MQNNLSLLKKKYTPYPLSSSCPTPSAPGIYQFAFCLYEFTCFVYFIWMELYNMWPCIWLPSFTLSVVSCAYHVFFNRSSIDGHVGCFYVLGYCDTYCREWVVTYGIWVPIFSDSLWYFVKYVTVSLHLDNFEFLSLYFSVMREFQTWTQTYFQCGLIEIIKAWSLIFHFIYKLNFPPTTKVILNVVIAQILNFFRNIYGLDSKVPCNIALCIVIKDCI